MLIEKVNIHNFKALQDVTLDNVPAVSVFVGKNGVGKTTLFRVFAFLQECLQSNVSIALRQEGGLLGLKKYLPVGKMQNKSASLLKSNFVSILREKTVSLHIY